MSLIVIIKALLVWFCILILAVINGVLRESVFISIFGSQIAYVVSGVLLSVFILVVAWFSLSWFGVRDSIGLLVIGFFWLVLTLVFEFSFGFFQGKSLQAILEAYTFKGGNIWPIVLVVTALAPLLAGRLKFSLVFSR